VLVKCKKKFLFAEEPRRVKKEIKGVFVCNEKPWTHFVLPEHLASLIYYIR
jgi:hypothetical protein